MLNCGIAGQDSGDTLLRRIRFGFSVTKAVDTHSEYVILIAFSLQ